MLIKKYNTLELQKSNSKTALSAEEILNRLIYIADKLYEQNDITNDLMWSPYADGNFRDNILTILEQNNLNETTHDDPSQPLSGFVSTTKHTKKEISNIINQMQTCKAVDTIPEETELLYSIYILGYGTNDSKNYYSKKSVKEFFIEYTNNKPLGKLLSNMYISFKQFKGYKDVDIVHSELEKILGKRINPINSYINMLLPYQDLFEYKGYAFMTNRDIEFTTPERTGNNIQILDTNCFRWLNMPVGLRIRDREELVAYTFFRPENSTQIINMIK